MGERMQCPVCQRYVSVTAGGSLRMHRAAAGPAKCEASSVLPATAREMAAKSRPSRPVLGGETGEDACRVRDDADWQGCRAAMATCGPDGIAYFDMATKCTADDARGPA